VAVVYVVIYLWVFIALMQNISYLTYKDFGGAK
jgi:hypothetical protein